MRQKLKCDRKRYKTANMFKKCSIQYFCFTLFSPLHAQRICFKIDVAVLFCFHLTSVNWIHLNFAPVTHLSMFDVQSGLIVLASAWYGKYHDSSCF